MLRSIVYFSHYLLYFLNLDTVHIVAARQIDGVGVGSFVGVPSSDLALVVLEISDSKHSSEPLFYCLIKV